MRFVIISDPNGSMGGTEFRVHREGCRDIKLHQKKRGYQNAGSTYTVDAETPEEAVSKDAQSYQNDGQDWTESDYTILPCCREKVGAQ